MQTVHIFVNLYIVIKVAYAVDEARLHSFGLQAEVSRDIFTGLQSRLNQNFLL